MIAYTFLVVLTLVVAYFEAKEDARHIGEHKPISHLEQLRERFYMVGVITLLAMASSWLRDGILSPNWACLFMPAVAWAVFTTPFRLFLNWRRGKRWSYVSASNWYDRQWIWVSHVLPGAYDNEACWLRAGRIATFTELSILALSTWGYIHLTNI